MDNFYTVGVIAGTHGLRGEVRVFPRTDFPSQRFKKGSVLHTRPQVGAGAPLTVATARPHKQFWLVSFDGYQNINVVDKWKGVELCVAESELIELPKDTYYIHQLMGLRVVADDGRQVGVITDVLQPGANDVYVVRGELQKQDVLIPAIPECILEVNLEAGTMRVHLLPGLLEAEDDQGDRNNEVVGMPDSGVRDISGDGSAPSAGESGRDA